MEIRNDIMPDDNNKASLMGVVHVLKKAMRPSPQSLNEIRNDLVADRNKDIDFIGAMKKHHRYLEESIAVLVDLEENFREKSKHLKRFLCLLNMHGKAEEETLYIKLQKNPEKLARVEGFSGLDEHDVAFQISRELQAMHFETFWSDEIEAKAKVLAALITNHIKEEEAVMFEVAKDDIDDSDLTTLGKIYIDKCTAYIDERISAPRILDSLIGTH